MEITLILALDFLGSHFKIGLVVLILMGTVIAIQVPYTQLNLGLFLMVLMLFGGPLKILQLRISVGCIAILNGVILMVMD